MILDIKCHVQLLIHNKPNCTEHIYYKWKVYSTLQNDGEKGWNKQNFQIVKNGPTWIPPQNTEKSNYQTFWSKDKERSKTLNTLTDDDREQFDELIRNLNTTRSSIIEAMVFCMANTHCSADIVQEITYSIEEAMHLNNLNIILARVYLISDLLHNSSLTTSTYYSYRTYFEYQLPFIFQFLNRARSASSKINVMKTDLFHEKMLKLLQIWNDWAIYDEKYISGLLAIYLADDQHFDKNGNFHFKYDEKTELGVKLKCIEEKLAEQNFNTLERICISNGLLSGKNHQQMINQILLVEDYKITKEKKNTNFLRDKDIDIEFNYEQTLQLIDKFNPILNTNYHDLSQKEIQDQYSIGLKILKILQARNNNIDQNDSDGTPMDEIDNKLYQLNDIQKNNQFTQEAKNIQAAKNIDGLPLTQEDLLDIKEGNCGTLCFHEISYLFNKAPKSLEQQQQKPKPEVNKQFEPVQLGYSDQANKKNANQQYQQRYQQKRSRSKGRTQNKRYSSSSSSSSSSSYEKRYKKNKKRNSRSRSKGRKQRFSRSRSHSPRGKYSSNHKHKYSNTNRRR